jgi:hypothetical protein
VLKQLKGYGTASEAELLEGNSKIEGLNFKTLMTLRMPEEGKLALVLKS